MGGERLRPRNFIVIPAPAGMKHNIRIIFTQKSERQVADQKGNWTFPVQAERNYSDNTSIISMLQMVKNSHLSNSLSHSLL